MPLTIVGSSAKLFAIPPLIAHGLDKGDVVSNGASQISKEGSIGRKSFYECAPFHWWWPEYRSPLLLTIISSWILITNSLMHFHTPTTNGWLVGPKFKHSHRKNALRVRVTQAHIRHCLCLLERLTWSLIQNQWRTTDRHHFVSTWLILGNHKKYDHNHASFLIAPPHCFALSYIHSLTKTESAPIQQVLGFNTEINIQ